MKIAVLDDYQAVARQLAEWSSLPGCTTEFVHDYIPDVTQLADRLSEYEVVVAMRERTKFPAALLQRLPRLRLLVTTGMVNRSIDLDAARALGIAVCGTPWAEDATVEVVWGLILALAHHIPREDASLRAGAWQSALGMSLGGKTLGVIGLGRIGTKVAQIGKQFGMQIIAWSPNLTAERAAEAGASYAGKIQLLERSDIVTMHLILSQTTRGILGAQDFARMKPNALIVNTARGPLIDENALAQALSARQIGGAAIDVFESEPISLDHPLLKAPNTILTPHIGYVTRDVYTAWYSAVVEVVAAFLRGKLLRHLNP